MGHSYREPSIRNHLVREVRTRPSKDPDQPAGVLHMLERNTLASSGRSSLHSQVHGQPAVQQLLLQVPDDD